MTQPLTIGKRRSPSFFTKARYHKRKYSIGWLIDQEKLRMEIEYKWNMPESGRIPALLATTNAMEKPASCKHMHAVYYDTADGLVAHLHGGLRIRSEAERLICCLKLAATAKGNCATRQEFEVDARDIRTGIAVLPTVGAPKDICEALLTHDLIIICETEFDRCAHVVTTPGSDGFIGELAFDLGEMRRGSHIAPIREIELEYKSGSTGAFHSFAHKLERDFTLERQPLSKLARAMALGT